MGDFSQWIETLGPTCMSGWLRERTAMYNYSDLTARLGHVVESGIRRAGGREPDFWHELLFELPRMDMAFAGGKIDPLLVIDRRLIEIPRMLLRCSPWGRRCSGTP